MGIRMASLAKRVLGSFLAATMLATPVVACAEEAETATSTEAAAATSSATDTQAPQLAVQFIGIQDRAIDDARYIVANASHNKVAIVVWGGNRTIQQEAYNAARDLAGIGVPVAFVLAPDTNALEGDAGFQVYAKSEPRFDGYVGANNAEDLRPIVRQAGLDAHREAFPQQVAALTVR